MCKIFEKGDIINESSLSALSKFLLRKFDSENDFIVNRNDDGVLSANWDDDSIIIVFSDVDQVDYKEFNLSFDFKDCYGDITTSDLDFIITTIEPLLQKLTVVKAESAI